MLSAFAQWRAQTRHELTEVGTEIDVDGVVGESDGALPGVRVRGRVDRLERDGAGPAGGGRHQDRQEPGHQG